MKIDNDAAKGPPIGATERLANIMQTLEDAKDRDCTLTDAYRKDVPWLLQRLRDAEDHATTYRRTLESTVADRDRLRAELDEACQHMEHWDRCFEPGHCSGCITKPCMQAAALIARIRGAK